MPECVTYMSNMWCFGHRYVRLVEAISVPFQSWQLDPKMSQEDVVDYLVHFSY